MFEPEVLVFMIPIVAIIGGFVTSIIKMKYKHAEKLALNRSAEGQDAELEGLSRIADILDQRVQVLEKILDDEVPDWRAIHDAR